MSTGTMEMNNLSEHPDNEIVIKVEVIEDESYQENTDNFTDAKMNNELSEDYKSLQRDLKGLMEVPTELDYKDLNNTPACTVTKQKNIKENAPEQIEVAVDFNVADDIAQSEGNNHDTNYSYFDGYATQQLLQGSSMLNLKLPLFEAVAITPKKKIFTCNFCGYTSYRKAYFANHLTIHTGEKPYKCNECDYSCRYKQDLISHFRSHNGEYFTCEVPECGYATIQKANLRLHMQCHSIEKPFKCTQCDFATKRNKDLRKHQLKHSDVKPFRCNECNYSSARRDLLIKHQVIHSKEKPFKCTVCSYSSRRKDFLNLHILTHNEVKPFQCDQCSFSTTQRPFLLKHQVVHTTERPYTCNICGYSAKRKFNLVPHLKTHENPNAKNFVKTNQTEA